MNFNLIEITQWKRREYFEHYLNKARCTYSLTTNIDITILKAELKSRSIKLYPALLHMLATVVNRHREFRTCFDAAGRLGFWDRMSPCYTVFHADDETFSNLWTEYCENFPLFYRHYLTDIRKYGDSKQFFPQGDERPDTFPVSCIPWVSFAGFNLNIYTEGTYLLPIFTIGKYFGKDGKTLLPLAIQTHHAVCDGYHTSRFISELQALADDCQIWLPPAR